MRLAAAFSAAPFAARADTSYFERTFFDNSLTPDTYFYSSGQASAPSTLTLAGDRLPVDRVTFFTPPNALRWQWISRPGGGWVAGVNLYEWRNRVLYFPGDVLSFWCYLRDPIRPAEFPSIVLQDRNKGFSQPLSLTSYVKTVAPLRWFEIRIPASKFVSASVHGFDPHRTNIISFVQNEPDGKQHTLLIDEIRLDNAKSAQDSPQVLLPPVNVQAKAYERHIDISWQPPIRSTPERYVIYRAMGGGRDFRPIGIQSPGVNRFADFIGRPDVTATYKVKMSDRSYRESHFSNPASATTHAMNDDSLLTMVQEASFRYYWEGAHPASGMIRENIPGNDDIVATGATGFGIMALIAATERKFINRTQALERLLLITKFLEHADRFHGAWPHFTNGRTGRRLPVFGMFDNGADLVETSFLMEGLLAARQYFKGPSPPEQKLQRGITALWKDVEWDWFRRNPKGEALYWHWSPEYAWYINHPLYGWNEVMITYLLAIASPTHPVPASLYYTGWAGDPPQFLNGKTFFGIKLDLGSGTGGPLFFTHYSYMSFDPRKLRDRFTNYFENNRNMAQINYQYCVRNAAGHTGYGGQVWGITAVDGPKGYVPYEPKPALDDGTIAPTGSISSFPYTPQESLAALRYFYRELGDRLWDVYGFRDAFNLEQNWFSGINMGLNQAPMMVMIENYRSGLLWKSFMANPEISPMLDKIGFRPDSH